MTDRNIRDAEIVRAIDTELLRRRQQFEDSPPRGASCAKPPTWRP